MPRVPLRSLEPRRQPLRRELVGVAIILSVFGAATWANAATLRHYEKLTLSPDGERLASVEFETAVDSFDRPHGVIVLRRSDTGQVVDRFDPCSVCEYGDIAFARDSRALAITASSPDAGTILYLADQSGVRRLASVQGSVSTPRWSPDGASIAMLLVLNPSKAVGATKPGRSLVGEIGPNTDEQRIATVAAVGGDPRPISPAGRWIYEYDWLPDGSGFVATSAAGDGDSNWWVATLDVIDGTTGDRRAIWTPNLQIAMPRVSPDGRNIAVIAGLMSDFGYFGGDIYMIPVRGGPGRNLTPDYPGSFTSLASWREDRLLATALQAGQLTLVDVPQSGPPIRLWSAPLDMRAGDGVISVSRDGKVVATVGEGFEQPPEIFSGTALRLTPITGDNGALRSQVTARSVLWANEGNTLQGWLLAPRDLDPSRKHPLVVAVHGGPAGAATPFFQLPAELHDLPRGGYFLFLPNARGSFGQGAKFTRANFRDFGGGDFRDILSGVEQVAKSAPIDPNRVGIWGNSYGGYMAMWAVTHTDRFKAAAAGAGVADWISYYGQNGIEKWMVPFLGATAYDDPELYRRISPITYVKSAQAPIFLYVGEQDIEVPAMQSFQFWRALRTLGRRSTLVVYPREGHGVSEAANTDDLRLRIRIWFDQHLGQPETGATPADEPDRGPPSRGDR